MRAANSLLIAIFATSFLHGAQGSAAPLSSPSNFTPLPQYAAIQGYECKGTVCSCTGSADCKELATSGFCVGGTLYCGTRATGRTDECVCVFARSSPSVTPPRPPPPIRR